MSFTHMATQSMPMVSWRPVANAIFNLVPTPSVPATSTGVRILAAPFKSDDRAEAADTFEYMSSPRRAGDTPKERNQALLEVDIDSGGFVGEPRRHRCFSPFAARARCPAMRACHWDRPRAPRDSESIRDRKASRAIRNGQA